MKRFAESEDPSVVVIPMLVRPRVAGVQLELGTVPVQVEDVRVAIAVVMHKMPSISPPLEAYAISGLSVVVPPVFGIFRSADRIGRNSYLSTLYQVSSFFKSAQSPT